MQNKETETEDGGTRVGRDRLPTLNRLVGDGFNGNGGFQQRPERDAGLIHIEIWKKNKNFLDGGEVSADRGHEAGNGLFYEQQGSLSG